MTVASNTETRLSRELWAHRMTQADLARKASIDPASVSRIVRGIEPAYPNRCKRIAAAIGWEGDPAELFEEVEREGVGADGR